MLRFHFVISQAAVTKGTATLQQEANLPARADRLMPAQLKIAWMSYSVHTAIFSALAQAELAPVCLAGQGGMIAAAV